MIAFALPVLLGLLIATSAVGLLVFSIFDADRRLGAASAEPAPAASGGDAPTRPMPARAA